MTVIGGLDTNRVYTADEVIEMKNNGKLREVTLKGWFFRFDMDGRGKLVHFTEKTANRMGEPGGGRRTYEIPDPLPQMREDVNRESPIVKRTPQERLASLTAKLQNGETGQEAAAQMLLRMLAGNPGMSGLTDEQVKEIAGASWKGGDPLDGETVRRVAANYLGQAERKVAEQARDTSTKAGRKAKKEQERLEAQERKAWKKKYL